MGDSSLILARDLRKRTRDQLISIVEERGISGSHIRDVFDLADALLEESSVADALAHIPRSTLVRVSSGQLLPEDQLLCRVGLAVCEDETSTSLPGVAVVAGRLCETWKLQAGDLAPTELAVNDEKASVSVLSRAGLERGLILVSALDELIERISTQSAKRHSNGVLAAGDTTRLGPTIEHVGISLDVALALCVQAGLLLALPFKMTVCPKPHYFSRGSVS